MLTLGLKPTTFYILSKVLSHLILTLFYENVCKQHIVLHILAVTALCLVYVSAINSVFWTKISSVC